MSGACSAPGTEGTPGSRSCSAARTPAPRTCQWTPTTRAYSTPLSGRPVARPGASSAAGRRAASSSPWMEGTPGLRSPTTPGCLAASRDVSASPCPPQNQAECGPPSRPRTAACTVLITVVTPGSWSATSAICKGVPGTTSTSSPIRRMRTRCGYSTTSAGSRSTEDATSAGSLRPTATTTTSGSTPTIPYG